MALFRSRDYTVGSYDGSLFGVATGDGKYGTGPRTNHLTSQKVYYLIDGDHFVLSRGK